MPLTRVTVLKDQHSPQRQEAIFEALYRAMREAFEVPEDDLFMMLHEVEPWQLRFGRTYLGFDRSDKLIVVQVTCAGGRPVELKKAFYARAAELLCDSGETRPDDIFINLVEAKRENWSFGAGRAQYAQPQ